MKEAIYQSLRGASLPYPNPFDDPDGSRSVDAAVERKMLIEEDEGLFGPNDDKPRVGKAVRAAGALQAFFEPDDAGHQFVEWFESEYQVGPDLTDRECWEALLG